MKEKIPKYLVDNLLIKFWKWSLTVDRVIVIKGIIWGKGNFLFIIIFFLDSYLTTINYWPRSLTLMWIALSRCICCLCLFVSHTSHIPVWLTEWHHPRLSRIHQINPDLTFISNTPRVLPIPLERLHKLEILTLRTRSCPVFLHLCLSSTVYDHYKSTLFYFLIFETDPHTHFIYSSYKPQKDRVVYTLSSSFKLILVLSTLLMSGPVLLRYYSL